MPQPEQTEHRRTVREVASENSIALIGAGTLLAFTGLGTYSAFNAPMQIERANTEQFEAGFGVLTGLSQDSVLQATRTESGRITLARDIKTAVTDAADALGAGDGSADEYLLTHTVAAGALRELQKNHIIVKPVSVYDADNKYAIGVRLNKDSGNITIPLRSNQSVDALKDEPMSSASGRLQALLTATERVSGEQPINVTDITVPAVTGQPRMVTNPNYVSSNQAELFDRVTEHSHQLSTVAPS